MNSESNLRVWDLSCGSSESLVGICDIVATVADKDRWGISCRS
jgi:hypothetical protein